MKILLVLGLLIVCFSSCDYAKLATVSSGNVEFKKPFFVFENDTVKITYRFWAENGSLDFDIYNKMSVPIFLNWKNSAYIPNDYSVRYWHDDKFKVTPTELAWLYTGGLVRKRRLPKLISQEKSDVIQPHSSITKKQFRLVREYQDMPKEGTFNKENSVFNFRNYLVISINEDFEGKADAIQNEFFTSDIKKIRLDKREKFKAENKFYVQESH